MHKTVVNSKILLINLNGINMKAVHFFYFSLIKNILCFHYTKVDSRFGSQNFVIFVDFEWFLFESYLSKIFFYFVPNGTFDLG